MVGLNGPIFQLPPFLPFSSNLELLLLMVSNVEWAAVHGDDGDGDRRAHDPNFCG